MLRFSLRIHAHCLPSPPFVCAVRETSCGFEIVQRAFANRLARGSLVVTPVMFLVWGVALTTNALTDRTLAWAIVVFTGLSILLAVIYSTARVIVSVDKHRQVIAVQHVVLFRRTVKAWALQEAHLAPATIRFAREFHPKLWHGSGLVLFVARQPVMLVACGDLSLSAIDIPYVDTPVQLDCAHATLFTSRSRARLISDWR